MSIFTKLKKRAVGARLKTKAVAAGFVIAIAGVAAMGTFSSAGAAPVSTPDCNANAVIWCGAATPADLSHDYHTDKGDGHNTSASIQRIYAHFSIDGGKIDNLKNTSVNGYVTKSGDVYATINGQNTLVATGAMTAGRQLILDKNGKAVAGQTKYMVDGTTFYTRKPSVSFQNNQLTAMVSMQNGQFQFAILVSCGNPVVATPKKPGYSIQKQVSNGGNYASSVSNVKSGSTLKYQITVSSTGQVPVQDVKVHDTLPSGLTYVKGSLQQDGKAVTGVSETSFFGGGITIASIKNGSKVVFTFQAKAGTVDYADVSCKPVTLNNTGYITAPNLPNENSTAKASTICAPAASLICTSLTAVAGNVDSATGDQQYSFTAKATATNATITNYDYDFGDGSKANGGATIDHTYQPGTRTASVIVTAVAPATNKTYTTTVTKACQVTITVKPPVSGALACTGMTAVPGTQDQATGEIAYSFTATAKVSGNAKITGYALTPDTGAAAVPMTMSANTQSATVSHTYAPGIHQATVQVTGTDLVTGKPITAPANKDCVVPITVNTLPKPAYSIQKQVATNANGPFGGSVTVASGSTVFYKITVSSTGNALVTNVNVSDKLPGDIKYTSGTLQKDGGAVSSTDAGNFFGNGLVIASIKNGGSVVFTFSAVAGNTGTPTDSSCNPETLNNTGFITATGLANEQSSASVNTTCTPECKPGVPQGNKECFTYTCDQTQLVSTLNNTNRSVTISGFTVAIATTNPNASLSSIVINWGDGASTTLASSDITSQASQAHNFADTSARSITVTPEFTVAGQTQPVPGAACVVSASFTTTPPPVLPNTGAGDVIGIFVGTVAAATIGFRLYTLRKLSHS